jgi:hypothetical protein
MTPERRQRILAVADELEAQGLPATNAAVYAICLGHRGHVVQVLKHRRAERNRGGVTVLEAEEDDEEGYQPSVSELEEDLQQLVSSYESLHLSLERIWELDAEGSLDEATFTRKLWLENTLTKNLQQQEALRPQLELARLTESVYAAQAQHDAGLPVAEALATQAVQLLGAVMQVWRQLIQHFEHQQDGFFAPRDARGHQAFPVDGGRADARRLFEALYPSDYRAKDAFELLVEQATTAGAVQEALANCPRLHPFSQRAITRYLEGAAS